MNTLKNSFLLFKIFFFIIILTIACQIPLTLIISDNNIAKKTTGQSSKDITQFTILGVNGTIGVNTINLIIPYGADPSSLIPTITITGATVNPASGTAQNFTSPVVYTVTAADSSTKQYTVTVTVALNTDKDITQFTILGINGTIGDNTIDLTVPYGTDLSSLTPAITITGASVNPASGTAQNFTSPVVYTVTAADSSTKQYTVTITVALNTDKDITQFTILGINGTIGDNTIDLTIPYGTDPSSLTPTITITGTSVNPASGTAQNFTSPVIYTVTAADSSTKQYTVTVTVALNPAKDITQFTILGINGTIGDNTIDLTVPYGTDPSSLTPAITITGASVNPASGTARNFTSPVIYTVTAADSSTKQYTVTVTVALNPAKDITQFTILGINGTIGANTIDLTVPYGTDPSSLTPAITITGATVNPASGTARNFTSPVVYTVTAADSSTKQYTVTVTVALNPAKDITQFTILGINGTIGSNTIDLTVPYGTDPSSLTPAITITGASVNPASGTARNFTGPVIYTVTAADSSTKQYTVTVTVALNPAKDITQFTILGINGTIGDNTIDLTIPYGTDPSSLTPAITITGASVNPASGTARNFTSPVVYTVTAADSSTKQYTVTVYVKPTVNVINIRSSCQLETGFIIGTAGSGTSTIASVEVDFDGGGYTAATGTINWKIPIPSGASTWQKGSSHIINVRSKDTDGNYSDVVSTTIRKSINKDVNGDGYADFGVGGIDWIYDGLKDATGRAYLYYGGSAGVSTTPAATITGDESGDRFGHSMTFGDLNGDGYADFIVGSMYPEESEFWGKVHIFYGKSSGIADGFASSADFILLSETDNAWLSFSSSLAACDLNQDGYDDLAVGSYDVGSQSRVHIFKGGPTGISGSSPKRANLADTIITGNSIGSSIAFGDINGDGYIDMAIGALYANSRTGRVYIVHGTAGGLPGSVYPGTSVTTIANTTFIGETSNNDFGRSVALGDINGDGFDDIVIGANAYSSDQGRAYIYHGSSSGLLGGSSSVTVPASANFVIEGTVLSEQGWLVAMGDVNCDGYIDVGISACKYNSNKGQTKVYKGSGGGLVTTPDKTYNGTSEMGWGIGFTDLNGDGYSDFTVSEPNYERIFIYNGSSTGTSTTANKTITGDPEAWFGSSITPNAGPVW